MTHIREPRAVGGHTDVGPATVKQQDPVDDSVHRPDDYECASFRWAPLVPARSNCWPGVSGEIRGCDGRA